MDYYKNHVWCSDSNWGGDWNGQYIISIDRVILDKDYHDGVAKDWVKMIAQKSHFDQSNFDELVEYHKYNYFDEEEEASFKRRSMRNTYLLASVVTEWLEENIENKKDGSNEKGWCVGSDEYNLNSNITFNVFFYRRNDALKFVRAWSEYERPVHYCDRHNETRKTLNIETKKYTKDKRD